MQASTRFEDLKWLVLSKNERKLSAQNKYKKM